MDQIFGIIERITFHNLENGFTVAKLKAPRNSTLLTVVGVFPELQPGESVRCTGTWKNNKSHGMQFEAQSFHIEPPTELKDIQKYLESGSIKGIAHSYAEKIVKKFGTKTLEVIEKEPERLLDIPGIGQKRLDKIKECWSSQKAIRNVVIFLQRYGISPTYAQKIYRIYGDDAIEKVQENPFHLARNITGIGFKMADDIAENMGFTKDAPMRVDAGIEYVLQECANLGHVCYPRDLFLPLVEEKLAVENALIQQRIEALFQEGRIHLTEGLIWIKSLYLAELGIARELQRLLTSPCQLRTIDTQKAITWSEDRLRLKLAPTQADAVQKSLEEKLHIITGGPGTGKSTITKAILLITSVLTRRIILTAPTGRAAKRMTEITGQMAFTIHSLLQYDFKAGGFKRNRDNPLECDLIIIDEASMIDTYLMYQLLKAIPSESKVLLIGDVHQLPSVGPGCVLNDCIESQKIPSSFLTKIFRQAEGSKIITNAHKINQGEFPDLHGGEKSDFFFIRAEKPEDVRNEVLSLVSKRLPEEYHFNPLSQIQVLAPMKRGIVGIDQLNLSLQDVLNPQQHYLMLGGKRLGCGDKVMQIRNNYSKEVYNGDIGKILSIDGEEKEVVILFEEREVLYAFHELDEIVLAYATSVHKFQGSECPCVIMVVHTSHFIMLRRNLLYTGITRGKKLVILVGTPQAVAIAVSNDKENKRHTALKDEIIHSLGNNSSDGEIRKHEKFEL